MHEVKHGERVPLNKIILIGIILALSGILVYRTFSYFKQVEIQTTQAVIKKGPGIEYQDKKALSQGERLKVIKTKYHWMYVKTDKNNFGWVADWMVDPSYKNPINSLADATIVLDPGHGGSDSGAVSNSNKDEKKYTLRYARQTAKKLRARGAKVYLTRDDDSTVSLADRPKLAEQVHADAFISFHFDSAPEKNVASGYTTYYYNKGPSVKLANTINQQFNQLGLDNRGVDIGDFLVIRDNPQPAVLLEMGYINSERDFEQITSRSYQGKATSQVVSGLTQYFKQEEK
ncbi:MAG TPA: N-acetylmuramoyl-L-alanine amidase [Candidatus Ligilactobacillus excrementavium]|nr:N-acetylmuramoyl-L-alanine amidase [Candidatus Ligilactobacillus excrementavium]